MRKILSILLIIVCIITTFCGCKQNGKTKYKDYSFDYFDTATTIVGYAETEEEFDKNCDEIKKQLEEYHKLYTIYNRYENITNICTINDLFDGVHKEIVVDKKIIDLLLFSKEMYRLTDGKVNVAMGSVLSIWHDYRKEGEQDPSKAKLPPIDVLKEASKHTNIDDVIIDKEKSTVYLADPKLTLDVGAIAKGYAGERIADWMEKQGISGYVLNVGGNVKGVGNQEDNSPWKAGIENPDNSDEENPYIAYLEITNEAIVTSGAYQRYYYVDGKRYHHIIDSETLMPGENYLSVSVVCDDSGKGDALSTALFLMDIEKGKKLIESIDNAQAMWVLPSGEKVFSSNFKKYETKEQKH